MTVLIDNDGYLLSPYKQSEITTEVEVDDETAEKLQNFSFYHNWRYADGEWTLECIDEDNYLRLKRQRNCFEILDNKSQMWYNCLTDEQNTELKEWYQAWLNVTDTKVMPETPEWLS